MLVAVITHLRAEAPVFNIGQCVAATVITKLQVGGSRVNIDQRVYVREVLAMITHLCVVVAEIRYRSVC